MSHDIGRSVLVIGSGGREHALAWALARSPQVGRVYVAPGNAGTDTPLTQPGRSLRPGLLANVPLRVDDVAGLIRFAQERHIDLTVVGPEAPLAAGLADAFLSAGQPVFGPIQAAARLEWSKAYAKTVMREAGIPTADFAVFTCVADARAYLARRPGPCVVKADGLAAGKGVIVCDDAAEARQAVERMLVGREFGDAGATVIIEQRLQGRELSVLAFSDGHTVRLMPPARDHKRVYDDDQGPNTGGMGAYAPAPDATPDLLDRAQRAVLQPVVDALARQGVPYVGVLYAGLMLTADGPQVLEFNCRFGDPETQAILPLLDSDLFAILLACTQGRLAEVDVRWRPGACAAVVAASGGYPGDYTVGRPIQGVDAAAALDDMLVFHAATARREGQLVTAGGRVLAVSAVGPDLPAALARAYQGLGRISFEGLHYRRDIGN